MTFLQKLRLVSIKIANPARKFYWFIARPKTRGANCLVEYSGKFLLVRLSYAHRKWTIPGGGVHANESFRDAAVRETREEAGINVTDPVLLWRFDHTIEYKRDTVEVYYAKADGDALTIDPVEIKEAGWFKRNDLPLDRVAGIDKIFRYYDEYRSKKS